MRKTQPSARKRQLHNKGWRCEAPIADGVGFESPSSGSSADPQADTMALAPPIQPPRPSEFRDSLGFPNPAGRMGIRSEKDRDGPAADGRGARAGRRKLYC